ncbi:pectin lyase fold/virulence factor [Coniochaeta sp. 2T2.1]|nr:pectin lyase fold/virulence factor [Coniochaeta sp. 2T2.1]
MARIVFLLSALLFGLASCHDSTRRVKDGESIQAVLNDANPGDHIVVEAGTYPEQLTITKDNIQLSAKKGATLVPPGTWTPNSCSDLAGNGTEAGICITGSDIVFGDFVEHRRVTSVGTYVHNVRVEGFTVIGFGLNIVIIGAKDAEVRKNTVIDGGGYGILTVGSISSLVTRNTVSTTTSLFFIGICMDDKSDVHVTQNVVSNYTTCLCVQTNKADVGHNKVSNCCFGAFVDPLIDGAKVTHNHITKSNPLCQTEFFGLTGGIVIQGATNSEVRHNDVSGISDYGNPVPELIAFGIGIVDDTNGTGAVAKGNQVTHNTLYDNELDILVFTTGSGNEVAHNNCTTPAELCGK